MSQNGWIRLHRKIQDCWFWDEKPYDRARAWVDLLLLAVHSDTKQSVDGDFVEVPRGKYLTSIRRLADRWGWSKDKVSKFLSVLEKDGMIEKTIVKKRTLLTVVNYDFYQSQQDDERTINGRSSDDERTVSGQSSDSERTQNKNVKNDKNVKNVNNNKPVRHKYGTYNNVLLSDDDFEKLKDEFPDWERRIENLSEYMASTGKSYKNHLATIRTWARKEKPKKTEVVEDVFAEFLSRGD